MYSRSDIPGGGAWDPWIQVQFMAGGWQQSNATLSIIVYEYRDRFRLGVPRNQSVGGDQDVCASGWWIVWGVFYLYTYVPP